MTDNNQLISSFVVRCNLVEYDEASGNKQWRIKVSHVQGEQEISVQNIEEAANYMKRIIEE